MTDEARMDGLPSSLINVLSVCARRIACDRVESFRRNAAAATGAARGQMQVVLVDINDLDLGLPDVVREGIARLQRLGEEHRALVVTVVQLSPADERIEPRRIDPIDELFLFDLEV